MPASRCLIPVLLFGALCLQPARAELPLPDAALYGQIKTSDGTPVKAGSLTAEVQRGGAVVLVRAGEFKEAEGADWYVVRIPLETNIGAPGPSGPAAREGDGLRALLLNGKPLELSAAPGVLKAGGVMRIDATVLDGDPGNPRYARGDCRSDGSINITDAVGVLSYLFLGTAEPACLEACDGDGTGTGTLNISDAVFILGFLFLGGPEPPSPGPNCGVDASPSELGCVSSHCV